LRLHLAAIGNVNVAYYTYLAAQYYLLANFCTAGYTCLCSHHSIGTNFHIMGNLDQVVQLYTFADNG